MIVIELLIRHCNQGFMLATIVPAQRLGWKTAFALMQNAFHIRHRGCEFLLVILVGFNHAIKETSRWKLTCIAQHNNLVPPQQCSKSILRSHLAGLVEDNDIETGRTRIEKLCNRERAHHKTRFDLLDQPPNKGHKFSYRHMSTLTIE